MKAVQTIIRALLILALAWLPLHGVMAAMDPAPAVAMQGHGAHGDHHAGHMDDAAADTQDDGVKHKSCAASHCCFACVAFATPLVSLPCQSCLVVSIESGWDGLIPLVEVRPPRFL